MWGKNNFVSLLSFLFSRLSNELANGVQRLAVKDVLPARIRALRSKDQGGQNVAEQKRAEGEARTRFCGA